MTRELYNKAAAEGKNPMYYIYEDLGINISCRGVSLKDDSMKIERSGNKIILEGLPIADVNHPRLPYDYFDEILRRIDHINIPQDLLFKIFQINILIRKKIIEESHFRDNKVFKIFTKLMLYEINLIASHN